MIVSNWSLTTIFMCCLVQIARVTMVEQSCGMVVCWLLFGTVMLMSLACHGANINYKLFSVWDDGKLTLLTFSILAI